MNRFFFTFIILIAGLCAQAQNIMTPNGYIPESQLNVGDKVIGYDNGRMVFNTIIEKRSMSKEFYSQQNASFDFYLINNRYKFFSGQSIYANGDVIHVSELKTGDEIYDENNAKIIVNKIILKQNEYRWTRFIISGNHSYINDGIQVHNASRFWVGGGSSSNWNAGSSTNWSATSGGSNNASVPVVSDDVTLDGAGANGNTAMTVSSTVSCLSLTFTSGYTNTATISTATSITIAGNFTDATNHSWTVNGTGVMAISATSTITSNGKTFPGPVTFSGASTTKTLSGNWTITGRLTINASNPILNATSSESLSCAGINMLGALASGTAKIILTGGTWSGNANAAIINDLDIAGNVTISGIVYFNTKTLTYVSGSVTTTGSTLTLSGASTLNTSGMSWNNVTIAATATYTLNSLLSCSGTLLINNGIAPTFGGTSGWTVATFLSNHLSSATVFLKNGVTYTITSAFNCSQSRLGSMIAIRSDDATNKAILTLNQGATCSVLATFTRIDASNGRVIYTYNGTVTDCININPYTDLKTVSRTFVQ